MFEEIFFSTLWQLIIFIGVIYLVGFIIFVINKSFYKLTGQGRFLCLATGFIGTPIHEMSHAIMCLLFFHKIEKIKLYQMDDENGVLGYVNHSYNKKNIYQIIGNYFIGVAPIIIGSAFLYLLIMLLLPSVFLEITYNLSNLIDLINNGSFNDAFKEFMLMPLTIIEAIFTIDFGFKTIVYLIICLCISMHMNLSVADISGSLSSIPFIIIIVLLLNIIFYFIDDYILFDFNSFVMQGGCCLIALLILSLTFSFVILLLGFIIKYFPTIIKKTYSLISSKIIKTK